MGRLFGRRFGQRILVVASDQGVADHLSEAISGISSGYVVKRAGSGFEGLQKVEDGVINIVLAADKLVDMTGRTFINIVQGLKTTGKKEPACVLMAENVRRIKSADMDCGVSYDIIRCPVRRDELVCSLGRASNLDGINGEIAFNRSVGWVLVALVPVVIGVGALVRIL